MQALNLGFNFENLKFRNITEQSRTEYLFCSNIYSLSQLHNYKMHGLLNIHIQFNNYSLD